MPYTMTTEENGKAAAIRAAMTAAKQLMQDAEAQMALAVSNADALMAIQKAAGRADSYNAAYKCKGGCLAMGGRMQLARGDLIQFHADTSADLQRLFTDGPAFALAAPGR